MAVVDEQVHSGAMTLGEITDPDDLAANLAENAVPASVVNARADTYRQFLTERRALMAAYIRDFYRKL